MEIMGKKGKQNFIVASLQLMRLYRLIGKEFGEILTEDKRIKAMSILARPCPRI